MADCAAASHDSPLIRAIRKIREIRAQDFFS
jgi:hypothetical protein